MCCSPDHRSTQTTMNSMGVGGQVLLYWWSDGTVVDATVGGLSPYGGEMMFVSVHMRKSVALCKRVKVVGKKPKAVSVEVPNSLVAKQQANEVEVRNSMVDHFSSHLSNDALSECLVFFWCHRPLASAASAVRLWPALV